MSDSATTQRLPGVPRRVADPDSKYPPLTNTNLKRLMNGWKIWNDSEKMSEDKKIEIYIQCLREQRKRLEI